MKQVVEDSARTFLSLDKYAVSTIRRCTTWRLDSFEQYIQLRRWPDSLSYRALLPRLELDHHALCGLDPLSRDTAASVEISVSSHDLISRIDARNRKFLTASSLAAHAPWLAMKIICTNCPRLEHNVVHPRSLIPLAVSLLVSVFSLQVTVVQRSALVPACIIISLFRFGQKLPEFHWADRKRTDFRHRTRRFKNLDVIE